MDHLPNELIEMIFYCISSRNRDIFNLAFTCTRLYAAIYEGKIRSILDEQKRLFNIKKQYVGINAAIRRMKYYIKKLEIYSISLRIDDTSIHGYSNKERFNQYELRNIERIVFWAKNKCMQMSISTFNNVLTETTRDTGYHIYLFDEVIEIRAILSSRGISLLSIYSQKKRNNLIAPSA